MDIDWNTPTFLDLPDLRMAVFEAGEKRDDRPSVVLCHGFPEVAYSWRLVVPPLVEAGFHVIAPDQRGYGFTGRALNDDGTKASVPLYDIEHLTGDMAHLLDAFGLDKAVFVGHDWGGIMMWQLPFFQPERIAGLIGVNTPFIPRLASDPIAAFRAALGDDFYICAFQDYGRAEARMEANVAKSLRCFYRAPDPDKPRPSGPEWERFEFLKILDMDETAWPGRLLFNDTDFAYYVDAFTRSGFCGGINWYRNFTRNWELTENMADIVPHPSLMICAANDAVLPPSMAENMPKYIDDLETHIIEDCGHWTQNEQPQKLAALMCDWLLRSYNIK